MINIFKKIVNIVIGTYDEEKPDLKNLEKKTKVELEKLGRKVGIELDKRLTKDKLIKQIKKHCK
jgi:hypothetical protein